MEIIFVKIYMIKFEVLIDLVVKVELGEWIRCRFMIRVVGFDDGVIIDVVCVFYGLLDVVKDFYEVVLLGELVDVDCDLLWFFFFLCGVVYILSEVGSFVLCYLVLILNRLWRIISIFCVGLGWMGGWLLSIWLIGGENNCWWSVWFIVVWI